MIVLEGYEIVGEFPGEERLYRAIALEDQRHVMLALYNQELDQTEQARLNLELQRWKSLEHPCLVKPVAAHFFGSQTVIGYEWRPSWESLHSVAARQRLSLEQGLRIGETLLESLCVVHEAGLIHGALNTHHIFIDTERDEIFLSLYGLFDFSQDQLWQMPVPLLLSQIAYMAPEQLKQLTRYVDRRSDLYSVGCVLYTLFAGRLPFVAEQPMELFHAQLAKPAPALRTMAPQLPVPVEALVMTSLAKDVEQRYQSADALLTDVQRCLECLRTQDDWSTFKLHPFATDDKELLSHSGAYAREHYIARLLREMGLAWQQDSSHLFVISGEYGVGKTTVAREIRQFCAMHDKIFLHTRCHKSIESGKCSWMRQMLRACIQTVLMMRTHEADGIASQLRDALGDLLPVVVVVEPWVGRVLHYTGPLPKLPSERVKTLIELVLVKLVRLLSCGDEPVVLFIDDLHLAEASVLSCLQLLLSQLPCLSVLVALQSGQQGTSPSRTGTDELFWKGALPRHVGVFEAPLKPLLESDLNVLLAAVLRLSKEGAEELAQLLFPKVGGNPLRLWTLLHSMIEEQILYKQKQREEEEASWVWDEEVVRALSIPDSLAEQLVRSMSQLPVSEVTMLTYAALIGEQSDLQSLALIGDIALEDLKDSFQHAQRLGLVFLRRDSLFFVHQRFRRALLSSLSEDERVSMHLEVAQALQRHVADSKESGLWDMITQHLNAGMQSVKTLETLLALSHNNKEAAQAALGTADFERALYFTTHGVELCERLLWEEDLVLALEIHKTHAQALFLSGKTDEALAVLKHAETHVTSWEWKARLTLMRITIRTLQARYHDALYEARLLLSQRDVMIPIDVEEYDSRHLQERIRFLVEERPPVMLASVPLSTNIEHGLVLRILAQLLPIVYVSEPMLFPWVVYTLVERSLVEGHTEYSVQGYSTYGRLLVNERDERLSHEAMMWGELALTLCERDEWTRSLPIACSDVANYIFPWFRPLRASQAINVRGHEAGIKLGDAQYAGYTLMHDAYNAFFAGLPLREVQGKALDALAICLRLRNTLACDVLQGLCLLIEKYAGLSYNRTSTMLEPQSEEQFVEGCVLHQSSMALALFYLGKATILLFQRSAEAARWAVRANEMSSFLKGWFPELELRFLHALILLRQSQDTGRQDIEPTQTSAVLERLQKLAKQCKENFLHKSLLVQAALEDNTWKRSRLLESAAISAKEQGFVQYEAFCHVLMAELWEREQRKALCRHHQEQSQILFLQWGLHEKSVASDEQSVVSESESSQSLLQTVPAVDFFAVLKACRVLSEDLQSEVILERLLESAVEDAGADRGLLFVQEGEELLLHAELSLLSSSPMKTPAPLSSLREQVPTRLLHYVVNSGETILLDDVKAPTERLGDPDFLSDPFFVSTTVRSILCLPFVRQKRRKQLLYLEHHSMPHAFSRHQVESLRWISAQAAITLDNANLLEQKEHMATRLRALIEALPDAVLLLRSDGTLLEVLSLPSIMDREEPSSLYEVAERLLPASQGTLIRTLLQETASTLKGQQMELSLLFGDETKIFEVNTVPLVREMGIFTETQVPIVWVARDITMRKRLENSLKVEHSMRAVGQLARGLVHDFKNVLSGMQGFVQLIEDDLDQSHRAYDDVLMLRQLNKQAMGLVEQLRAFDPNRTMEWKMVHLSRFLHKHYRLLQSAVGRNVQIQFQLVDKLPKLRLDVFHLERILLNLCTNARDALPQQQGHVLLRTAIYEFEKTPVEAGGLPLIAGTQQLSAGGYIVLEVQDDGSGIESKVAERIFEPFFSTKILSGGSGLGMVVVYNLVRELGGELQVFSASQRGTLVRLLWKASAKYVQSLKS